MRDGSQRHLPALLTGLVLTSLVGMVGGGPIGEGAFALAAVLLPVALIALGAGRVRRGLRVTLAALGSTLVAGTVGLLLLPAGGATPDRYVLGLPPATWVAFLALGVVPFVIVGLGYAASFTAGSEGNRPDG